MKMNCAEFVCYPIIYAIIYKFEKEPPFSSIPCSYGLGETIVTPLVSHMLVCIYSYIPIRKIIFKDINFNAFEFFQEKLMVLTFTYNGVHIRRSNKYYLYTFYNAIIVRHEDKYFLEEIMETRSFFTIFR